MFSIHNFSFFKKILIFYFQCYNFDSKSIKNHHNTVSKEFQNETDIKLYCLLLVIIAPNSFLGGTQQNCHTYRNLPGQLLYLRNKVSFCRYFQCLKSCLWKQNKGLKKVLT